MFPFSSVAVAAVIADEDAFVRHAAIRALAATSTPGEFTASATRLSREFPDQRALVIQAMAQHNLDISPAFIEAIATDEDPDHIVACLGAATDSDDATERASLDHGAFRRDDPAMRPATEAVGVADQQAANGVAARVDEDEAAGHGGGRRVTRRPACASSSSRSRPGWWQCSHCRA